jgi:hypothetical protein
MFLHGIARVDFRGFRSHSLTQRPRMCSQDVPILTFSDISDQASVDRVVAQTQVVISTAGPFARIGTPVVDASVRLNTHYCDITGKIPCRRPVPARPVGGFVSNRGLPLASAAVLLGRPITFLIASQPSPRTMN